MPTYIDPHNSDCRITCPGNGGAAFIPPYTCVTWCDNPAPLIDALSSAVQERGWTSRSSIHARLLGMHAAALARALQTVRPVPSQVGNALESIIGLGGIAPETGFPIAWQALTIGTALELFAVSMRDQLSP
jgi:hypothetical protein